MRQQWLTLSDSELLAECVVDTFRSSGPGGQKRNKTESAVRLRHPPSGVMARAVESRSQHDNKAMALVRLRINIAIELRCPVDEIGEPERLAIIEMIGLPRPSRMDGYLERMAMLLDLLAHAKTALRLVADDLGLSSAAIARCLRSDEHVRRWVNQQRAQLELGPLR